MDLHYSMNRGINLNGWEFEATDIAQSKFRKKKDQEYVLVIEFSLDGGIRDVRWEDSNLLYSLIKTNHNYDVNANYQRGDHAR